MPATPKRLFERLDALGISVVTVEHEPLFTVEQSRVLRGGIPGGHCKSLFLKDKKGGLWLVVALEDAAIDLKSLARRIGAGRLSFASPELLFEMLGVTPGSVTPFAVINDERQRVSVILDKTMMANERVNFHPLTNCATTTIASADLTAFILDCGHTPTIISLTP